MLISVRNFFYLANIFFKSADVFFQGQTLFRHISRMVGPIDVKWKGSALVGYWVNMWPWLLTSPMTMPLNLHTKLKLFTRLLTKFNFCHTKLKSFNFVNKIYFCDTDLNLVEQYWILSLDNMSALVQLISGCQRGTKPLPEPSLKKIHSIIWNDWTSTN